MKLKITSEPESNATFSKPQYFEAEVTTEEATLLIERDLQLRQQAADTPEAVKPRTAQEILTELGRRDYKRWHTVWRQDRDNGTLCSFEVWNEYGGQESAAHLSAEDELIAAEEQALKTLKIALIGQLLDELIADLPDVQRAVFIAVVVAQRSQVDVAVERGVSKPAISKNLAKAMARLRAGLAAAGVNSADVSGLLVSDTNVGAQEGKKA
ncbi:MAG: sigma factor-like helix-turn-helix DNA-binding protein [Actinomycetaceae bacterium]|nr:sigma factor-like helix-turn-helix DNA-binding protein [Actinomycetaceae bacterium]